MQTKIKVTVYAKKLRDKLKELEAKRKADLEKYKHDFTDWKNSLKTWVSKHASESINDITVQEVKDNMGRHFNGTVNFDARKFFLGCPEAPKYPGDKQIRDIKSLLRHLGITGQETITVSTEDVARHLGDGEKYEE